MNYNGVQLLGAFCILAAVLLIIWFRPYNHECHITAIDEKNKRHRDHLRLAVDEPLLAHESEPAMPVWLLEDDYQRELTDEKILELDEIWERVQ